MGRFQSELGEIPYRDLQELAAYHSFWPLGNEREDYRSAVVASTVSNRLRSHREKPKRVQDFMPFSERRKITDPKQIEGFFAGLAKSMKAQNRKKKCQPSPRSIPS